MGKFEFKNKATAKDYLDKLEPAIKAHMAATARMAGEFAGLSWKQVQLMGLKEFFQLQKEFAEFNELGDDPFLGKR